MNLNIESIHFIIGKKLGLFIEEKIKKLIEHNHYIIDVDVVLVIGNKPENKIVEIKLNCNGCSFYAKKQSDTFEHSVDMVVEALRRQLRKQKTKRLKKEG